MILVLHNYIYLIIVYNVQTKFLKYHVVYVVLLLYNIEQGYMTNKSVHRSSSDITPGDRSASVRASSQMTSTPRMRGHLQGHLQGHSTTTTSAMRVIVDLDTAVTAIERAFTAVERTFTHAQQGPTPGRGATGKGRGGHPRGHFDLVRSREHPHAAACTQGAPLPGGHVLQPPDSPQRRLSSSRRPNRQPAAADGASPSLCILQADRAACRPVRRAGREPARTAGISQLAIAHASVSAGRGAGRVPVQSSCASASPTSARARSLE